MSDTAPTGRLVSLDAFRGLTIAGMILVNNPGSWSHVYPPLLHAPWHGWTPTDLIFPFFLFIVGVSMAFSLPRRRETLGSPAVYLVAARRAAIIFLLGILLNLFPSFDFASLRVAGVLQRIGLVYLVAAPIVLALSRRAQAAVVAGLLVGYWAVMRFVPVPGGAAGDLSAEGNLATWFDGIFLPGRMWQGTWDPEGLLSTLPAIATTLLGTFTGYWLRSERPRSEIAAGLFTVGWVLILTGLLWSVDFPINKNIWTSSFVLFTAGAALEALGVCYWLIDGLDRRGWARPAIVYGMNPIAVYVVSGLVTDLLHRLEVTAGDATRSLWGWGFHALESIGLTPKAASLAQAIAYVVLWWGVALWLYRRRIFLRI